MSGLLTITGLTLHEAARRRILLATALFGVVGLVLFGFGLNFIHAEITESGAPSLVRQRMALNFLVMAGLYAVNFLMVMTAVLVPADSISGEIASGVMQTIASKPVRRVDIVLGKWLAFAIIVAGYLALMAGGVLVLGRVIAGTTPPGIAAGLALMLLEGLLLMTLSIAGGTRFSTITNGVIVFGLFGLAFIGGWVEQIGTMAGNEAARDVGTIASLIMPSESLWQLAAWHMQPGVMRDLVMTPFSPASVPSLAMVVWAVGYMVVVLTIGVLGFRRRNL
jgi:ABC-type transport system involved in multi-copper enzyme maturation permease subunit